VVNVSKMISLPPRHFCVIANPTYRDENNQPEYVEHKAVGDRMVKLRYGNKELRLDKDWTEPFPLYPGEELLVAVTRLRTINEDSAIHVMALLNCTDETGEQRSAGDEWLIRGPCTYYPRVEYKEIKNLRSIVVRPNEALKVRARRNFTDSQGIERKTGESWLYSKVGAYLPHVYEEVLGNIKALILTEAKAVHFRALHDFTSLGKSRVTGSEWLVTQEDCNAYIPGVNEEVVGYVNKTSLSEAQYCNVVDPVDEDGIPQLGHKKQVLGPKSFFLQPGESLENGIQDVMVLGEEEALLLKAMEPFADSNDGKEATNRVPGEEWMIYGPRKYVPPVEIAIVEPRRKIALDENEGIYVRDKRTGRVYTVKGRSYMLQAHEMLWEKELPSKVEELLDMGSRVKHRLVRFRVPHNHAVQIYDYKARVSRVVYGPELVTLEPDEQFTIISVSGGQPKVPNALTSLSLPLGPDFMSDEVIVETSDHARLRLKLSYNWTFDVDKANENHATMIFSVRDFVGDTCKAIASRVRGAVALSRFDDFHKNSAEVIKKAVFGRRYDNGAGSLMFSANRLVVTNVDVQSVDPIEADTRAALQESVQMAIEIATKSQEAVANHEAEKEQQISDGKLQRQRILDEAMAEEAKRELVESRCITAALKSTSRAKNEAMARAESAKIAGQSAITKAGYQAQEARIKAESKLKILEAKWTHDLKVKTDQVNLEIEQAREVARIETKKFQDLVNAIGPETITAIARAGPEMQAELLEGLGLSGFLVTDGASPVNLFNTANGLVGGASGSGGMGGMGSVMNGMMG